MRIVLAALLGLAALPAAAATVTETTDFSSDWFNPTAMVAGTTQVQGTASDLDVLLLTGLKTGAQVLSFSFSGEGFYTGGNLSSGGSILYSATPFQWAWDNDGLTDYAVHYNSFARGKNGIAQTGSLTSTAVLQLSDSFAGSLYLAIVPWGRTPLAYSFDVQLAPVPVPAPVAEPVVGVSPVPVPAAGLMLGAGLIGLLAGRRRKAA